MLLHCGLYSANIVLIVVYLLIIHATTIYPGSVKTELLDAIAPSETKAMVEKFYEDVGMTLDIIANTVLYYALSRPDNVNVLELVIRSGKEA